MEAFGDDWECNTEGGGIEGGSEGDGADGGVGEDEGRSWPEWRLTLLQRNFCIRSREVERCFML